MMTLGHLYDAAKEAANAENCYVRALRIRETIRPKGDVTVIESFNAVALCYAAQGKHDQIELLARRVLSITSGASKTDYATLAVTLSAVGVCYWAAKITPVREFFSACE